GGDLLDHVRTGDVLRAWPRRSTGWRRGMMAAGKASTAGGGWGRWAFGGALVLLMIFTLFPFYWAIVASFTSDAALFRDPSLIPQHLIFDLYRALFSERDFITPIRNSPVVAGTTTLFCPIVGTLAASARSRFAL